MTGNRRRIFGLPAATMIVAAWGALCFSGAAQGQGLNLGGGSDQSPIEVTADDGIEWQQEALVFIARGKARAHRGDVELFADELRAYYRETKSGTDIWRLDALGHVRIVSPNRVVYGEKGVYDVDNAILVVSGGDRVRMETATEVITAKGQLEYWETKKMAVAREDATAIREGRKLRADVLAAHFVDAAMVRVEAFDNVRIDTATERVRSDRGVYNVKSGIATLTGSVKITKDGNQLNGCSAEINMKSGVSKMFACKKTTKGGKGVHTLLRPKKKKEDAANGAPGKGN